MKFTLHLRIDGLNLLLLGRGKADITVFILDISLIMYICSPVKTIAVHKLTCL